jgi:8-oxo-dGTP pyrophosphatase MutT (NUDIX family)
VREVVEETEMPAVNFTLQASIPPLHFSQYPPRKVDVYLATLTSHSEYHPSVRPDWRPSPNPETRRCRWFSLQEIMHYFEQANVWRTTYTRIIIEQLIRRQGWQLEAGRQEGSNQPQQPSLPPPPQPSPPPQA